MVQDLVHVFFKADYSYLSCFWLFVSSDPKFQTDTYSMDFDLDFVYPEEEEGLDENEEGEGVTQPHSGEKLKNATNVTLLRFMQVL